VTIPATATRTTPTQRPAPDEPRVSVIVPSYRPGDLVHRCLESLLAQRTRWPFEIVFVDSSPERVGDQIADRYPGIRVVQLASRAYPGTARNEGLQVAEGDIIAFTDTDVEVAADWVDKIVDRFANQPELQVVAGAIVNARSRHPVAISEWLLELSEFSPKRKAGPISIFATANVAFRRSVFEAYGRFVDSIKGSDALFARWLADSGRPAFFDPSIVVRHYHRTKFSKYLRNQFELGRGGARNRKRFAQLHGAFVARYPVLVPLLPFVRTVRIIWRLAGYDRAALALFLLLYPLNLIGLGAYTAGFFRGLRD